MFRDLTHDEVPSLPESDQELAELSASAAAAITLLERIRERRALLALLSEEQRSRLLQAAGHVARPDPWAKRELLREAKRRREQGKRAADELALAQTGIRKKRREQVFVTPPALIAPVAAGVDSDVALADAGLGRLLCPLWGRGNVERLSEGLGDGEAPSSPSAEGYVERPSPRPSPRGRGEGGERLSEARSCYVCKRTFRELHFFYDSMCGLRRLQLERSAHSTRRPDGSRGADHRRAREDRLPGGHHAAARRRAA